jgi:2-hydroxychromene-2-carboxylate isomerase
MKSLTFYFDFLSPYSYFAWPKVQKICDTYQLELICKPVIMAKLFQHFEIKGPGEVVPKRNYMLKALIRYAKKNKIPFIGPKFHPFNPLYSLRIATGQCSQKQQHEIISNLWQISWGKGEDLGDPDIIAKELNLAGFDGTGLLEKSSLKAVKEELKLNTAEAIKKGIFGVPTMVYADEVFWGLDSLDDLENVIQGKDYLDHHLLTKMITSATIHSQ